MKIGVLALQGAFIEHEDIVRSLGADSIPVRLPRHLGEVDGLIIPGGESTAIGKLARRWGLLEPLRTFARSERPVWGTCAGMILLASDVAGRAPDQPLLGAMDVTVRRNAFGRQVDSFETEVNVPVLGERPYPAIFIRAPLVERVGEGVRVLAELDDGTVVAVQQNHLLATAFHPELTDDDRFHRYFLEIVQSHGGRSASGPNGIHQ